MKISERCGRIRKLLALFLSLLLCGWCLPLKAELYIIVVDTSGSMLEPVSKTDPRIRMPIVQEALARYLLALPEGAQVRLISFNKGIITDKEFTITDSDSYRPLAEWVQGLAQEAQSGKETYLWTTLDYALRIATEFAEANAGDVAYVRVLTDGLDTEKKTTFDEVLNKYPLVDGQSIRGDLVILGDIEMAVVARPGFNITRSPDFADIFPPVIQWNPRTVRVRVPVSFFDNSETTFVNYDWAINGQPIGTQKAPTFLFKEPGRYQVTLQATAEGGRQVSATQTIRVLPTDLTADFVIPSRGVIAGRPVTFLARPAGQPETYQWSINGQLVSENRDLTHTFDAAGPVEITLTTTDVFGNSVTNSVKVEVLPPPPPPEVAIVAERIGGPAPLTTTFAIRSSQPVASVIWDFGNGMTSDEPTTTFTFTQDGSYQVTAKVAFQDPDLPPVVVSQTIQVGDQLPWWVWTLIVAITLFLLGLIFRGREPRVDGIVRGRREVDLSKYAAKGELNVPLNAFDINAQGDLHLRFIGSYRRPTVRAYLTHEVAKIGSRRYRPGEQFELRRQTRIILNNGEMLEYLNPRLKE